jgi:hypothetical protein
MKKLENIPKKEVFTVPDGYFDTLRGKIQARISNEKTGYERGIIFRHKVQEMKLQYALPAVVLLSLSIYWFSNTSRATDAESLLASVQTEDLMAYLSESELTTEDILETVAFSTADLEQIESEVYELNLDALQLEDTLNDLNLEDI